MKGVAGPIAVGGEGREGDGAFAIERLLVATKPIWGKNGLFCWIGIFIIYPFFSWRLVHVSTLRETGKR